MTAAPLATVVIVPRERFSPAPDTFAHLRHHSPGQIQWVYVDAGTPASVRSRLESLARDVEWVHCTAYRSPNQARNLGLSVARGKYVVFIDNDVMVTAGWLERLVNCAEETGAWVVGPLYMIGDAIHMAGGTLRRDGTALRENHCDADSPRSAVALRRTVCDYVEFHAMLIRRDKLEPLDEGLFSLHEHIDVCLSVAARGGQVYLEPDSVVTYLSPPPFEVVDIPYFTLRWSEAWNGASTLHFKSKWQVTSIATEQDDDRQDTSMRWARGHRRRLTGVTWRATPMTPEEYLTWIVAALMSVDCDWFEVEGPGPAGIRSGPELLSGGEPIHRLRPLPLKQADRPVLCLHAPDDLAFLRLESRAGPIQSWGAVLRGPYEELPWIGIDARTRIVGATLGLVSTAAQWSDRRRCLQEA